MPSIINATTTAGVSVQGDNSGSLQLATNNGTTAVTIDTSQNVGIGTTSPTTVANKNLQVYAGSGLSSALRVTGNGGTGFDFLQGTDGVSYVWNRDNTATLFGTNNTERMRIDSSGNLLVGTTASFISERATFVSAANTTVMTLRYSGATAGRYTRFACDGNNAIFIVDNNGTGQYQNYGSSSWTAISDERYKDIIEPIENATEKVASLRSVIGKLKTDPEGTRKSFLIAQDVQKVFPEAVDSNNPEKLGIAYTDIIPLLVASIKELNTKVEAQAVRIAELEGAK